MSDLVYIGIDVSKAQLDVACHPAGKQRAFANDSIRIRELVGYAKRLGPSLIVMEATGGYQIGAASELAAADFPVAVVNPRQVRDFAKSRNLLAKTDAIDATVLAEFARVSQPEPRPLPDPAAQKIRAPARRGDLTISVIEFWTTNERGKRGEEQEDDVPEHDLRIGS